MDLIAATLLLILIAQLFKANVQDHYSAAVHKPGLRPGTFAQIGSVSAACGAPPARPRQRRPG
ncbi:MAG: hypothetical protein ACM3ML_04280 [Micromonosporaceae bacterium]